MSKFLDLMLRPEAEDVQKNLPTARYEVKRLSRLQGEPAVLELRDMERDQEVHILLAGCSELTFLYWLFRYKNKMPWEVYDGLRLPGYRDLTYALASYECESWPKQ